jgi:hypothetical protein
MQAFEGDEDEIVVAALRERVNTIKRARSGLIAEREAIKPEPSQILLSPNQIDSIVTFAHEVQNWTNGATYENKLELIKLLNVRVDLVHDGDMHRLEMSCDLPDSNYAEIIHRRSTMRNFCIRISSSIPLPKRNKIFGVSTLVEQLFTSMILVTSE